MKNENFINSKSGMTTHYTFYQGKHLVKDQGILVKITQKDNEVILQKDNIILSLVSKIEPIIVSKKEYYKLLGIN